MNAISDKTIRDIDLQFSLLARTASNVEELSQKFKKKQPSFCETAGVGAIKNNAKKTLTKTQK